MRQIRALDFENTPNISTLTVGCALDGTGGSTFNVYIPDVESLFDFGYEIEVNHPIETILGKQKNTASLVLDLVNQGNSIAETLTNPDKKTEDIVRSSWSQLPAFKGIKPLTFSNQIDIEYYFGQAGFFDSKTEVYEKGIELIKMFMPTDNSGSITQDLLPLPGSLLISSARSMYQASQDQSLDTASTGSDEEVVEEEEVVDSSLISKAYEGLASVVKTFNESVRSSYKNIHGIFCKVKYGALSSPVFFPKSFGLKFNCEEMDSEQYPLKVVVSLKSCQTPELTTKTLLNSIYQ